MGSAARVSRAAGGAFLAVVVWWTAAAPGALRAEDESAPGVDEVLAKIDAALFFPDAQKGLARYECNASTTTVMVRKETGTEPDRESAKRVARVVVDAASGAKTWTAEDGTKIEPGTWTPKCGPWTLTNVVRFEVELFTSPLSRRFTEDAWRRTLVPEGDGWRLTLVPRKPLGPEKPFFLRPVVTSVEMVVGKDGVPTKGTLRLDQGPMKEVGTFTLEFAEHGKLRRIARIRNVLKSANLTIRPSLTFAYAEHEGFSLLESVVFRVPTGNVSPTLGRTLGGDFAYALIFDDVEVKASEPAKPDDAGKPGGSDK